MKKFLETLPRVITELGTIYSTGIPLLETYEGSIVKFYTMGYCSHLAHLIKLFCKKANIPCKIVWIVDTYSKNPSPYDANHIGCLIDGKFYDIENTNGLDLSVPKNYHELINKYSALRILSFPEEFDEGFDEESCETKSGFTSYQELVDHVYEKFKEEI